MKHIYKILLLLLIVFTTNILAQADNNLLILNSYHPNFRRTYLQNLGIQNSFFSNKVNATIYIEYLDAKNFLLENIEKQYLELFKAKYSNKKIKVVIVTDNPAFYFVKKYKNSLFQNSYVVFSGIVGFKDEMIPDKDVYTGVVDRYYFKENIELILKLFPETKEIVTFFDASIAGRYLYEDFKEAKNKYIDKVKFKEILNPSLELLKTEVGKLQKGQILLVGELSQDNNGNIIDHKILIEELTKSCKVPIFTSVKDYMKDGILGGKLTNQLVYGKLAGNIATKILSGTKPSKIKIIKNTPARYTFNYRELTKYNINENLLPKNSSILYKPASVWETNKEVLIKIAIWFGVLILIIITLSIIIIYRKKAEKEIKKSKEYIEKILSSLTDCVWSIHLDKNLITKNSYFSPVIEQIYGYSYNDFKENPDLWRDIVFDEDKEILKENYNKLMKGDINNVNFTFRIKRNDERIYWIEQSITLTETEDGGKRLDGIAKNVTEKVIQHNEIIKYSKAIEQSPVSIIITDINGNIEFVNPHFTKNTGYELEEVIGKKPSILKSGLMSKELYEDLWAKIIAGENWVGEFCNKKKNGELFWEIAAISPVKNDYGKIINFVAVKEDITKLKTFQKELLEAKEKAEKADRLKDEFLAQMSHEIRTPINAILSFSGLIKDELEDKIDDDLKMSFNIMARAGKRIIRTIDLILNMAELQTGYFKPTFEEINIKEKIEEIIEMDFMQLAKDKKLELKVDYKSTTTNLTLDRYTFEVILKNLVDNAIKYTFNGFVAVNVYDYSDTELAMEVKDTGIGISEEYLSNLFEPFSQEEQGYTRRFEGNGLGLALIKKYTELNNAKINVKSKKGEGSTFIVYFNK